MTRDEILEALQKTPRHTLDDDRRADALSHAVADIYAKASIDHLRLVRVERMLEFLLGKQVAEIKRRPSTAELEAYTSRGILAPAFIIEHQTWLADFEAAYETFKQQLLKSQPAAPIADNAGESDGKE